MPWLSEVLKRIPKHHRNPQTLKDEEKRLKLLTFISLCWPHPKQDVC